jgi:hypothetical protein
VDEARKLRLGTAETMFGLSWFLLDGGWLMGWRLMSYPFIVIAVASAIARFFWLEEGRVAMHVAASECAWLAMNVFWVLGDFETIAGCIIAAKIFLLLGLIILARTFMISPGGVKEILLRPIRRLRVMLHHGTKS